MLSHRRNSLPARLAYWALLVLPALTASAAPGLAQGKPTAINLPDPIGAIGQPIVITATLRTAESKPVNIANRQVDVTLNGGYLGSGITDKAGKARVRMTVTEAMGLGKWPLVASFGGDAQLLPSYTTAILTTRASTTDITFAGVAAAIGKPVALKGTLKRNSDGTVLAGMQIDFYVNGAYGGSAVTGATGVAQLSYVFDEATGLGVKNVTASFAGVPFYAATAETVACTVSQGATKITPTGATGNRGATVSLKGKLFRSGDLAVLNGRTLTFSIAGTVIGTATTLNGVATLSFKIPSTWTVGKRSVRIDFAGDTFYTQAFATANFVVK